jgi:hypothetical protein
MIFPYLAQLAREGKGVAIELVSLDKKSVRDGRPNAELTMHTSVPKVVDNAIVGYVIREIARAKLAAAVGHGGGLR